MGEEQRIAVAASVYLPVQAINPITTYTNQKKEIEKLQIQTELRNNLLNNVIDYQRRRNEYQAALDFKEREDSEAQIRKLSAQVAGLGLESTTDPQKIEYGLNLLGNLFRYNQFHKTNSFTNDLIYHQKIIKGKAEERLAQLKQGQNTQNGTKWYTNLEQKQTGQTSKNLAAFEFQKTGERDFLS